MYSSTTKEWYMLYQDFKYEGLHYNRLSKAYKQYKQQYYILCD